MFPDHRITRRWTVTAESPMLNVSSDAPASRASAPSATSVVRPPAFRLPPSTPRRPAA